MKNFSELLDTNSELSVSIDLRIHGRVEYHASLNKCVFADKITTQLRLKTDINFVIQLQDFNEGTSGIEVVEFSINGLEILPRYQHLATPPTNYIDKIGIWRIAIPAPFYSWYHNVTGQGWLLKPVA